MILAGMALSVLAAVAYALAAVAQHGAVRDVRPVHHPADGRLRARELRTLITRRRWLLGLAGTGLGAALHVTALSLAPLVVVQPIGVLAIGLTAVLSGARLTRGTLLAVLACTAGVALFVLLAAHDVRPEHGPAVLSPAVLPAAAGAVVALLLLTTAAPRRWRSLPLAAAAGVAYGTVSVLTRVVARQLRDGGLPAVSVLAVLGGLVAIAVGAWCVQQAYAAGRPDTVLACQTVIDPAVGVLMGLLLLGEAGDPGAAGLVGQLCAAGLALAGVLHLARRAQPPDHPTPDERVLVGASHSE
jgi:hypothetical protein